MLESIKAIRADIQAGKFTNEASVSLGIVLRLLHELSWDIYNTRVVWPEYALQGRRVDYALCHPLSKPIVFIEVKQIGQGVDAEKQLFEYAFHAGIPLAVLTTGQEWNFFLPGGRGSYSERRVYRLDLLERDPLESAQRLQRYLSFHSIASGDAIEAARKDYESAAKAREIRQTLPEAWKQLVAETDEILIELLGEKVESLCGYRPDTRTVVEFLKGVRFGPLAPAFQDLGKVNSDPITATARLSNRMPSPAAVSLGPGFVLNGTPYRARSAADVLIQVFQQLAKRDATFLERFAYEMRDRKSRRYLARSAEELYLSSPHLAHMPSHCRELFPNSGWWIDTHLSRDSIERVIRRASDVAGLKFGKDLVVTLQ
jgi:hypothetical protein